MHRFYHSNSLDLNQIISLDEFASHHALRVMRVKVDDFLILFNGDGFEYRGRVSDINKKTINVEILSKEKNNNESTININLFQSISSNEKMDMVIQKATELGVSSIQPIFTSRSTIKLSLERAKKRLIHWRQVSISACEQSGRSKIPTIKSPIGFDQVSEGITTNSLNLLLHPDNLEESSNLPNEYSGDINIFIGPEGGFNQDEVLLLKKQNCTNIQLGKRILRTETAPLAIIAILQYKYGDFA
ncbi:16S rRNA (uracil(1498)-N(3))-methyltransferase [Methylophilaceae bacterium]|nr:16S rRNA (uracil(1498)-N(3))-methyltransferase [Methylophilaceae bacterium]|tara:strand:+ start:598 stop:1329 length:732 start_codon:yes stop_codon:yes gene_type:complete